MLEFYTRSKLRRSYEYLAVNEPELAPSAIFFTWHHHIHPVASSDTCGPMAEIDSGNAQRSVPTTRREVPIRRTSRSFSISMTFIMAQTERRDFTRSLCWCPCWILVSTSAPVSLACSTAGLKRLEEVSPVKSYSTKSSEFRTGWRLNLAYQNRYVSSWKAA
jgi:hypothetical protein